MKLHLMEAEVLEDEKRWPGFGVVGENVVEKGYPKYVAHAEKADKGRELVSGGIKRGCDESGFGWGVRRKNSEYRIQNVE